MKAVLIVFSDLAVLLVVGCTVETQVDTSLDEDLQEDLAELEELENLSAELDDINFSDVEDYQE